MVEKGKVRNIGISKYANLNFLKALDVYPLFFSFNIRRIKNLTANPLKIMPAVNQVELSYWNPQPELLKVSQIVLFAICFYHLFAPLVVKGERASA